MFHMVVSYEYSYKVDILACRSLSLLLDGLSDKRDTVSDR